jgi:hypothetical protein
MYPIEKYQFKVYEKTNEDGTKSSVVVALSTYCGKIVKGVAKCMSSDAFSLDTGTNLAAARCDLKVCERRSKRALKKKQEAEKKLEELTSHYIKMSKYYDDAIAETYQASKRLRRIEEELE